MKESVKKMILETIKSLENIREKLEKEDEISYEKELELTDSLTKTTTNLAQIYRYVDCGTLKEMTPEYMQEILKEAKKEVVH